MDLYSMSEAGNTPATSSIKIAESIVQLSHIFDTHVIHELDVTSEPVQDIPGAKFIGPYCLIEAISKDAAVYDQKCRRYKPKQHDSTFVDGIWHLCIPRKPLFAIYAASCIQFTQLRMKDKHVRDMTLWTEARQVTRALLLQNPEHMSALNLRRRILCWVNQSQREAWLQDELILTELVLSVPVNAKSAAMWHHRRHLLSHLYPIKAKADRSFTSASELRLSCQLPSLDGPAAQLSKEALDEELVLVMHSSTIYRRNYFAWRHRMWVLGSVIDHGNKQGVEDIQQREARSVLQLWKQNPTDHSAATYLSKLHALSRHLNVDETADAIAQVGQDMLARYGERETPWLLHRYIVPLNSPWWSLKAASLVRRSEDAAVDDTATTIAAHERRSRHAARTHGLRSCLFAVRRVDARRPLSNGRLEDLVEMVCEEYMQSER